MLRFVLGRNYADKTEYVRNLVAGGVKAGDSGFIIIVPEQFSYQTERSMLERVGTGGMSKLEVLSFSRLAELVFEESGKGSLKPPVDDGVRVLTMSLALEGLGDKLNIFRKYISRPQLTQNLVSLATEMKQCSVTPEMLSEFALKSEPSSLKDKLEELSQIFSLYNAMLERSYFDTNDSLSILSDVLNEFDFFRNKTVIIDEFSRFTKQELAIVEKILVQSNEVYITYCTDFNKLNDDYSLFANVNGQIMTVKKLAEKNNIEITESVLLENNTDKISPALAALESGFYSADKKQYKDYTDGDITVCSAANITDECNFVAMSVKKLMRNNGVRCRDIVVYQRSKNTYDKELAAAFNRYGVPFFEDKRQPVDMQPLVVFVRSLLSLCCKGITTERLMRYLKTGLTPMTEDEICELENYAFVWQLKTSQWKNDFTGHPEGYGHENDDFSDKELAYLNKLRKKAVLPVISFKKAFDEADAENKTAVLYDFLISNKVNTKLKELAKSFSDEGREYLYEEQNAVWELVMNILDRLYRVTENQNISGKRYLELFEIILSVASLGELPRGMDSVTVAVADRSRIGLSDYVFILGANEGLFPLRPSTQGLLNDKDRITLRSAGIELAETAEYKSIEEEYIAYKAVCSARKKLYISYCGSDLQGRTMSPSGIVSEVVGVFPEMKTVNFADVPQLEKIESDASAFDILAESINENPELFASVEEYFRNNKNYSGRVDVLKNALLKTPGQIKDKQIATELFGKNIYFSASKTEEYHNCPFKFFCRYGLKAYPRKKAQIDVSLNGTILHEVFEKMLFNHSKQELETMSDEELKKETDEILNNYLNENMGGASEKTRRFLVQYSMISQRALSILKRIIEELKTSEFEPVEFEMKIGKDGKISPYTLELDDGGVMQLSGYIDRVDMMEKEGKKYLRIIDYKSGSKTFNLADVFCGLNTQMLIYLFAIYTNGTGRYKDIIPSGIFYMSAKTASCNLPRHATQEQIDQKRLYDSKNKLDGMVIDDIEVIRGMESDLRGIFIPASLEKDGSLKGNVIPLEKLLKLNKIIDDVLKDTAMSLHNGIIPALPDSEKTCKYCDYKTICGFEKGDNMLEIPNWDFKQAIQAIDFDGNYSDKKEDGELNG